MPERLGENMVERVALAIEATMFAPHELSLPAELRSVEPTAPMIGAANIGPDQAISNLAKWANWLGLHQLPEWLTNSAADNWAVVGAVIFAFLYPAAIWGIPYLARRLRAAPQATAASTPEQTPEPAAPQPLPEPSPEPAQPQQIEQIELDWFTKPIPPPLDTGGRACKGLPPIQWIERLLGLVGRRRKEG